MIDALQNVMLNVNSPHYVRNRRHIFLVIQTEFNSDTVKANDIHVSPWIQGDGCMGV